MAIPSVSTSQQRPGETSLWPKIHYLLTGVLLIFALAVLGLALFGLVHVGKQAAAGEGGAVVEKEKEKKDPEKSSSASPGGRFQIERVEDASNFLEGAGKLGFFGANILEAWVFKYQGGYLECSLETDINGQSEASDNLPGNWTTLLSQDEAIKENKATAFDKHGFIVLTALPSSISVTEALANYHFQVFGMLAGAPFGPHQVLLPFHMEVSIKRPYRLYLSAGPPPKVSGTGFNLWAEHLLPIRGPFLSRDLASEPYHVGGGKDLTPGKDIQLLERHRGNSRIRLKARFLGDGEVRDLARR